MQQDDQPLIFNLSNEIICYIATFLKRNINGELDRKDYHHDTVLTHRVVCFIRFQLTCKRFYQCALSLLENQQAKIKNKITNPEYKLFRFNYNGNDIEESTKIKYCGYSLAKNKYEAIKLVNDPRFIHQIECDMIDYGCNPSDNIGFRAGIKWLELNYRDHMVPQLVVTEIKLYEINCS